LRLAIVGFGLIGGSIARAVRDGPARAAIESIAAWSPSGRGPAAALADGAIDRASSSLAGAVEGAELIVLAADPLACLGLLDELARLPVVGEPPTITDVASTKALLLGRADQLGLHYVGGHPMAGLEAAGYANARADLFLGWPWVLCPGALARPIDLERAEQLLAACRAERHWLGAAEHDRAVAAISHLPLVVAAALVESVSAAEDWPLAEGLAAGGWLSATRLARGDVTMGAGIAATNAPELARRLHSLRTQLDDWLADLEGTPDDPAATAERIRARLSVAKRTLEAAE
jgi:prephenate dehydrogenase